MQIKFLGFVEAPVGVFLEFLSKCLNPPTPIYEIFFVENIQAWKLYRKFDIHIFPQLIPPFLQYKWNSLKNSFLKIFWALSSK